jgi:hypothetical protein
MENKMGIKVVATKRGYYEQLLEPGQLFEIPSEKYFSERWMKKFEDKKDTNVTAAPKRRKRKASKVIEHEPETLTEALEGPSSEDWSL